MIEGKNPKLQKFYNATNKLLCGMAATRIKCRLSRDIDAAKQQEEKQKDFAQQIEDEYRQLEEQKKKEELENAESDNENVDMKPIKEPEAKRTDEIVKEPLESIPDKLPKEQVEDKVIERPEGKNEARSKIDLNNLKTFNMAMSDDEDENKYEGIQKESISWPKDTTITNVFTRIILYPVNLLLYLTVPTPRVAKDKEPNYLPLVFTMSLVWMAVFAYFITWWLVTLSLSFDLPFLILPMFILPAGLFLRDFPHWIEFGKKIKILEERAKSDAEIAAKERADELKKSGSTLRESKSLFSTKEDKPEYKEYIPEFYSGPIFTFTMGTSLTWLVYTLIQGAIELTSAGIYLQILLLTGIMLAKIVMVIISGFTCPKWLFYAHMVIYAVYLALVLLIEFTVN